MTLDHVLGVAARGRLYAILDACDAPAVPEKTDELGETRAVSLYRGESGEDLWAIAPYLCQADPALVRWIRENLWNEPWGVFFESVVPLEIARTHFRKFLIVKDPKGVDMYFRFYDPRVLRTFLLTVTDAEAQDFFKETVAFLVPSSPRGLDLEEFTRATSLARAADRGSRR